MPEVTVLTAVRNGARYVGATIASVLAQTFSDWEYIVVDDASTDGTPSVIERYAAEDCRIQLVRRLSSAGPFAAANEGLARARGTYVVRTDGDDVSLPTRIAEQVGLLRSRPELRACATFCQALDDAGPIPGAFNRAPLTSAVLKWELCLRCNLVHSSACIRREALLALGGYGVERLAQDYRLWCELARRDWLAVLPTVLVHFRRHSERLTVRYELEQARLATDVLGDHIRELVGRLLDRRALAALRAVGLSAPYPIPDGLRALAEWDAWWQEDRTLDAETRAELARISAFRRRKFVRCNARRQPVAALLSSRAFLLPAPASASGVPR